MLFFGFIFAFERAIRFSWFAKIGFFMNDDLLSTKKPCEYWFLNFQNKQDVKTILVFLYLNHTQVKFLFNRSVVGRFNTHRNPSSGF